MSDSRHKFVPGVPPARASREVYAANVSRRVQVGTRSGRRPASVDRQYTCLDVVYNRSRPRRRRYSAPVPATACRRARARAAKSRIRSTLQICGSGAALLESTCSQLLASVRIDTSRYRATAALPSKKCRISGQLGAKLAQRPGQTARRRSTDDTTYRGYIAATCNVAPVK